MNKIISFYLLLFSVAFAVHLGNARVGKARLTGIENQQPVAYIDSIKPSPVDSGVTIYFGGHGTDDGTIAAYDWDSNQDGQLSTLEAFNKSDLSVNAHTIWFKVQDNLGMWSDSVSENITITEPTPPTDSIGAEWCETLIGGWWGYPDTINASMATDVVYTTAQLITAINNAQADDIIYLMDTCEFNMSGQGTIVFDNAHDVTMASGRGTRWGDTVSHGALVYHEYALPVLEAPFRVQKNTRFTGIRFKGPISEIEGEISTDDSLNNYTLGSGNAAIYVERGGPNIPDTVEIDNCEFWGWAYASLKLYDAYNYVHHCYFHDGVRLYMSYGIVVSHKSGWATTMRLEANYFDKHDIMPSGVTYSEDVLDTICYNIFSPIMEARDATIYLHGDLQEPQNNATAIIFSNTVQRADLGDYGNYTFFAMSGSGTPKDSIRIHHNWFWDSTQIEVVPAYGKMVTNDNFYNAGVADTMPEGLSARIPTAVIWSSVDSCVVGTAAATVEFCGDNSSDPGAGEILQYYWWFGDSMDTDNFARKTSLNVANNTDTVTHTFGEIGKYTVRLTVVDDNGYRDYAYKTINVKPDNDNMYLSFWSKDNYPQEHKGLWERQCWLIDEDLSDTLVIWTQDIAGDGSWEHIVVNIDSVINAWDDQADDSVKVMFFAYCIATDGLGGVDVQHVAVFDDIVLYGGNVVNGDFETGYPVFRNWGGETKPNKRTDGYWDSDFVLTAGGHNGCNESSSYCHAGSEGFLFRVNPNSCAEDDYNVLWQMVDIIGQ